MASIIQMPRFGDTMEEGLLVRWLKKEGDEVSPGEAIAEVETDKATLELESFEDGVLRKRLVEEGTSVAIGVAVAIMADDEDEDISQAVAEAAGGGGGADSSQGEKAASSKEAKAEAGSEGKSSGSAPKAAADGPEAAASDSGSSGSKGGRIKASPLAKKMAEELGVALGSVEGSGPSGRIIARDIDAAAKAPAAETATATQGAAPQAEVPQSLRDAATVEPLNGMRKTIARRMVAAKQAVPHFYLTIDVSMDKAVALRSQLNEAGAGKVKISYNDMVLKACAKALVEHPYVNASFDGDQLLLHPEAHVGIAVALDGGLITPVVRSAQMKSIGAIATEARSLARRALEKKLKPNEYQGGTFTVSNLGMFGIREFVAIIDPPQAAIMAVGAVEDRPVVADGTLVVGKMMTVTLSCDHRVIDGATGAEFLKSFRAYLEEPMSMLL